MLLLPTSPPKNKVHHDLVVFKARTAEFKNISLSSSLVKDWIVCSCCKIRKTEGCWNEKGRTPGSEWAQPYICILVHVPRRSNSIWILISNLKALSTPQTPTECILCRHVFYWGLKVQYMDYRDYLVLHKTDYRRHGWEQILRPVLWKVPMTAVEQKQGASEMRAGGVAS